MRGEAWLADAFPVKLEETLSFSAQVVCNRKIKIILMDFWNVREICENSSIIIGILLMKELAALRKLRSHCVFGDARKKFSIHVSAFTWLYFNK